jgi:hypothetical protein
VLEDNASCDGEAERSPMIIHVKLFSSLRHAHLHNFASDTEWKINSKKRARKRGRQRSPKAEKFYLAADSSRKQSQTIALIFLLLFLFEIFFCCLLSSAPALSIGHGCCRTQQKWERERGNEDGANGK